MSDFQGYQHVNNTGSGVLLEDSGQYGDTETFSPEINSTTNSSNVTAATHGYGRDEELAKVEIAVQATILYFALFGNMSVLIVLRLRRKKLSRMQWFIVHLSCADLFVAIFNILPQMIWDITYNFYGNDFLCRAVKYFQVVAMFASSYVLVMCAIDRYLSICHPLTSHTWTPIRGHIMILAAWIMSLLFSLPNGIIFSYKEVYGGVYNCLVDFDPAWTLQLYITWIFVAIFVIPFIILTFAYGCICHVVWRSMKTKESSTKLTTVPSTKSFRKPCRISFRHENGKLMEGYHDNASKRGSGSSAPRAHTQRLSRAKMKTIKLTLAVILCYVICWAPFFIAQMWSAYDENAPFTGKLDV